MTIRDCILLGGPMGQWEGEYSDQGQSVALFGPEGERDYVYRIDERATNDRKKTDKKVVWRFDPRGTEAVMLTKAATGVNPLSNDESAWGITDPEDDAEPEVERTRVEVKLNGKSHEWELIYDGKIEAVTAQVNINNKDDAKNWIASIVGAK